MNDPRLVRLITGLTEPGHYSSARDVAFDKAGNLYFSDSGHWKQDDGRVYRASAISVRTFDASG